tara:strand:- start:34 stop:156 length:123 start_codon:yes stop_codon:yes gene_type:complete
MKAMLDYLRDELNRQLKNNGGDYTDKNVVKLLEIIKKLKQ